MWGVPKAYVVSFCNSFVLVFQASAAEIDPMSTSISEKMANLAQAQEMEGLKAEIRDLEEKLETLKVNS